MLKINENLLISSLKKAKPTMPANWAARYAAQMIQNTDARLEPNVIEWLHGKPLTDLRFPANNGESFSISSLLSSGQGFDFLEALEIMNLFFTDERAARGLMVRVYM